MNLDNKQNVEKRRKEKINLTEKINENQRKENKRNKRVSFAHSGDIFWHCDSHRESLK